MISLISLSIYSNCSEIKNLKIYLTITEISRRNIIAQHSHYWSCSSVADWIRGTKKIKAGTSEDWHNWNNSAQRAHKFRFWLAEEALDGLQDFITWPVRSLYNIKYYINNRWVSRTHSLTAHPNDIKPGTWCDVGNRVLLCMFNELVDFVEIETAWTHVAWSNKADIEKYNPPFWARGWFRWRTWRCPQAGIDHLNWAMKLVMDETMGLEKDDPNYGKPTYQAIAAKEIYELYTWWTTVYRNRPDPMKASGWSEYCDRSRDKNAGVLSFLSNQSKEDRKESRRIINLLNKIEKKYELEDTQMLIRLVKIRKSLWT